VTGPELEARQCAAVLARGERAALRLREQLADHDSFDAACVDLDDVRLVIDANRVLRRGSVDVRPPTVELGERAR